jgi:hypothetical protein
VVAPVSLGPRVVELFGKKTVIFLDGAPVECGIATANRWHEIPASVEHSVAVESLHEDATSVECRFTTAVRCASVTEGCNEDVALVEGCIATADYWHENRAPLGTASPPSIAGAKTPHPRSAAERMR